MMDKEIAILKVLVVGLIVMVGFLYRRKTWRTQGFYVSVTMNSVLFTALAVGIVLASFYDVDVLPLIGVGKIHLTQYMVIGSLPLGLILYEFIYKRQFSWRRAVFVTIAWLFVFSVLVSSNNQKLNMVALSLVVISGCFALGMINGILGPILPALALAKVAAALFWVASPQVWTVAGLLETIQHATDLGLDSLKILPAWIKLAGGALLVVLGMGEAFQFYGLKPLFDQLFGRD